MIDVLLVVLGLLTAAVVTAGVLAIARVVVTGRAAAKSVAIAQEHLRTLDKALRIAEVHYRTERAMWDEALQTREPQR